MRTLVLGTLLLLICCVGQAQFTGYHATEYTLSDTTAATTSWDSVYIGPYSQTKYLFVKNQGGGILKFGLENDTSLTKCIFLRQGESYYFDHGVVNRKWIRTKGSATVNRYIFSTY